MARKDRKMGVFLTSIALTVFAQTRADMDATRANKLNESRQLQARLLSRRICEGMTSKQVEAVMGDRPYLDGGTVLIRIRWYFRDGVVVHFNIRKDEPEVIAVELMPIPN